MPDPDRLPLPALLSAALVAFTIEFDNEAEHRMAHRTSWHGRTAGTDPAPWLVSLVMWENCMRYAGQDGLTVGELGRLARTPTNLAGMQRWGYITVGPDHADVRGRPGKASLAVRATRAGRAAQQVWQPLEGIIEQRWRQRFGADETDRLAANLAELAGRLDPGLPDCLPILGYGLFSRAGSQAAPPPAPGDGSLPLVTLLARVLLAFAVEFEGESELSLAICANVLRVLTADGVLVRDLPVLSGVSKQSISMAMGVLGKRDLAVVEAGPAGSRAKAARLTPAGLAAQKSSGRLVRAIEARWHDRFGAAAMNGLRDRLGQLAGDLTAARSPLFRGLVPYPDNWRASVRSPACCRAIRWSCIAAGIRTAASAISASAGQLSQRPPARGRVLAARHER